VPGYIFILVLLVLMWFLLIRPQRRRQMETQRMINSVTVGSEVVTAGGLYGTVTALEDDDVHLEIADGIEVRVAKRAIAGTVTEDEEPEELDEEDEEEEEELTQEGEEPEEESAATLPPDGVRPA
jgi:preprotein translocase subunit YajC